MMQTFIRLLTILFFLGALVPIHALDEHCTVSILNRNIPVKPDGTWVLPNVPANLGLVRAR